MPFAAINGIELYFELEGDGPALVFCHGADGNHLSWWRQIPAFRSQFRCLTFDHRGFGGSKVEEGQGGDAHYVADLHALLEHLQITTVRLVGQSMGCRSALGYTLAHPDRVAALVIGHGLGSFSEESIDRRLAESRASRAVGPDFIGALAPNYPEREPTLTFLYQEVSRLNPKRPAGPASSPIGVEELHAIRAPTLVLSAEHDQLSPPDVLKRVHGYIPGSSFHVFEGAGHSAHFEKPDEYNAVLGTFLGGSISTG